MTIDILAVHLALAGLLFLTMNWLGRHSAPSGYMTLSLFLRQDEAPAFNLIYRAVGPVVFLLLVSSVLHQVGLERYIASIWLVVLYYYAGRLLFVVMFDQVLLLNWAREAFLFSTSVGLAWVTYSRLIRDKHFLLPDVDHISNHIWVLIALFVYAAFNSFRFEYEGTTRRKNRYLHTHFARNKKLYGDLVKDIAPDPFAESLVYTILLYEGFNRPPAFRALEHLVFPWLSKSLGPMQVTTDRRLSDQESVKAGAQRIVSSYGEAIEQGKRKAELKNKVFDPLGQYNHRRFVVYKVAAAYNKDDDYVAGITELHGMVLRAFYPGPLPHGTHWSEGLI